MQSLIGNVNRQPQHSEFCLLSSNRGRQEADRSPLLAQPRRSGTRPTMKSEHGGTSLTSLNLRRDMSGGG